MSVVYLKSVKAYIIKFSWRVAQADYQYKYEQHIGAKLK